MFSRFIGLSLFGALFFAVYSPCWAGEVGAWRYNHPAMAGTFYISKDEAGRYFLKIAFDRGRAASERLTASEASEGTRFTVVGSAHGEYYVHIKDGSLKAYDSQGLISVLSPIQSTEPSSGCYEEGVKFGRCVTMSAAGKQCHPGDDIMISDICKNKPELQKGVEFGISTVVK